jgi:multidrug resistance protein, MATE family
MNTAGQLAPGRPLAAPLAAVRPGERVWRPMALLSLKLSLAMLAPLLMSLYVARLVARQGDLVFSGYSIVTSTNTALFIVASSFLQVLFFLGGRALGHGDGLDYRLSIRAGFKFAAALGLGATVLSALAGALLALLGYEPALVSVVRWQGPVAALGLVPPLLLVVYRVHASLNGRAGFVTAVAAGGAAAGAVITTLVARSALLGPEATALGVLAALAAVNWLMLGVAFLGLRSLPVQESGDAAADPVGRKLRLAGREIWSYGWPIAAVVLMDCALTLSSTLAMGRWWIDVLPVHSVVVLWMALGLIVPLGIAQTGVQHVAISHARGDFALRNRAAAAALAMGALYGVLAAFTLKALAVPAGALLLPSAVDTPQLQAQLRELMLPGGMVLAFEGLIVIAASLLRGVGLTRAPLLQALVGYAVFGSGGQWLFAGVLGQGAVGLWWGLVLGFGVTAVVVSFHCIHQLGIVGRRVV